jgi:hypothetical protein
MEDDEFTETWPIETLIMLNAKKLSELLVKNVDPKLYPRMLYAMQPSTA